MLRLSACILAIAACDLAAARSLEEYEPCLDKAEGDSCTLCSPSDVDCIETMVVKVCVEGECIGVSTPPDEDDEEEAAGACECGWTSTYPCPGTPRRWWQRFAADDGSACFNFCCPKPPPSAPPAPPTPPPTPPFVCETGCAWTDLHPCPGTPKKFWQTYATDDGTDCFNACCFSPAVASKASSLVSCSPLLLPALVLILLAIACGASWPTAASGKGARRGVACAVCVAAAAACLPGAAAAPAESSASSTTFSWFTEGGAMPLSFIFAVGVFAATADLVLRQLRWRRNSTAAFSPPVLSPPPSPPESGGPSAVITSFDDNNDVETETTPLIMRNNVETETTPLIMLDKRQRATLKRATVAVGCAGFIAGILFLLLIQSFSQPPDGESAEVAPPALALPAPNTSSNCTNVPEIAPSELVTTAFVDTFFNTSCIASGATGDTCDLHVAHEYTRRSFAALRVDSLIADVMALMATFSLYQLGGIPRPTDANGTIFWLAWMATQLSQWILTLVAISFEVFNYLSVRAHLGPCLVTSGEGGALLDLYAMSTFAVQPALVVRLAVLFINSYLICLGMLVLDGSREWQWPSCGRALVRSLLRPSVIHGRNVKWYAPIRKADFVSDATSAQVPKRKKYKSRVSLALPLYHAVRWVVLGAAFSVWATRGHWALAGVGATWALAGVVAGVMPIASAKAVASAKACIDVTDWNDTGFDATISLALSSVAFSSVATHLILRVIFFGLVFGGLAALWPLLPLAVLFWLAVNALIFLGNQLLGQIEKDEATGAHRWRFAAACKPAPDDKRARCSFEWLHALAKPTQGGLGWIGSLVVFTTPDAVLGRAQSPFFAFTDTSVATLSGGLRCTWLLLAMAPCVSYNVWARAWHVGHASITAVNVSLAEEASIEAAAGDWSWVWSSLMLWLCLGFTLVLCACCGVVALVLIQVNEAEQRLWTKLMDALRWAKLDKADGPRIRFLMFWWGRILGALLFLLILMNEQRAYNQLVVAAYANSFEAFATLQIEWNGLLPSFDRLAELLSDPGAAISSLVEVIASLSRYATLDPSYFVDGVEALDALTFVISLVRLLATYGRKLFALVDTAKAILKTHMSLEAAFDGDDGTAQVFEAVTDPSAVRAMDLLVAKELASVQRLEDLAKETSFQWDAKGINDGDMVTIAWIFRQPAFAAARVQSTVLETLHLGTNEIGSKGAREMASALRVIRVLTNLVLWNNNIGDEGAEALAAALRVNGVLKTLNLHCNNIRHEGAAAIAGTLRSNGVLTHLDLGANQIREQGAAAIAEALRDNRVLTSLEVGFNSLTEESALGIVRVERQRNKLTSLGLGGCSIGPTGAAGIAEYVSGSGVLKTLWLGDNNIGDEGAVAIADALRVNAVLTSLNLAGNDCGDEGAAALASALRVNGVLTKLNLDGHELDLPKLRGTDPVESLDLSGKDLGLASAIVIASLIAGNGVLTTLNLRYNGIGAEGAKALASALRVNGVLTNLDLYNNSIGDVGAAALGEALKVNGVLTELDIGWNQIGDEGATAIAEALRGNGVLTTLILANNQIREQGAAAIAEALRGNGVLTNLVLWGNNIGDEGAKALASALRVNGVLTTLDLRWNDLGDEGEGGIQDAVSGREGFKLQMVLKTLNIGNNNIGPKGVAAIAEALRGNGVLTSLDVGFNVLTEEAALGIVRVERQRNKLTSLGLAGCSIGQTGTAEIAEYVSGSGVLTELDLSGSLLGGGGIGDEGAKALASALRVNGVLTKLNLPYNSLGDEGEKAIRDAVSERVGFELEM